VCPNPVQQCVLDILEQIQVHSTVVEHTLSWELGTGVVCNLFVVRGQYFQCMNLLVHGLVCCAVVAEEQIQLYYVKQMDFVHWPEHRGTYENYKIQEQQIEIQEGIAWVVHYIQDKTNRVHTERYIQRQGGFAQPGQQYLQKTDASDLYLVEVGKMDQEDWRMQSAVCAEQNCEIQYPGEVHLRFPLDERQYEA
jgi:hypothetical protein